MGFDKLSFDLGGETVLGRSIRAFEESPLVSEIVLVAGKNREYVEAQAAACTKPVQVVQGGATRAESWSRLRNKLARTILSHKGEHEHGNRNFCASRPLRPASPARWKA